MTPEKVQKGVEWLVKNWAKIPDNFKTNLQGEGYYSRSAVIAGLPLEEHIVILLVDRQKPSVEADYSFDEERIAVTRTGKVIWGFDSGCSCPSPWHDSYPDCYSCSRNWKEFAVELKSFDTGVLEECMASINEIKAALKKK